MRRKAGRGYPRGRRPRGGVAAFLPPRPALAGTSPPSDAVRASALKHTAAPTAYVHESRRRRHERRNPGARSGTSESPTSRVGLPSPSSRRSAGTTSPPATCARSKRACTRSTTPFAPCASPWPRGAPRSTRSRTASTTLAASGGRLRRGRRPQELEGADLFLQTRLPFADRSQARRTRGERRRWCPRSRTVHGVHLHPEDTRPRRPATSSSLARSSSVVATSPGR